jgi:phospholipid/cholesterol/gamma-HCH transport system ATP-binding protein
VETLGMLFQQGGLFDSLPVWENIAFKLINRQRMGRDQAKRVAIEKLAMVNLTPDTADLFPVDLSGGMRSPAIRSCCCSTSRPPGSTPSPPT